MNIKKIIILQGQSQYGALDYFNRQIANGFNKLGVCTEIVLLIKENIPDLISEISNCDMIFSFNGMGQNDKGIIRDNIIDNNVLCWSFLVDHPYYHHNRLKNAVSKQIVSTIDKKHLEYLNAYYPDLKYNLFVPHGGSQAEHCDISFDKREFDISFFGSYENPKEYLKPLESFDSTIQELFVNIVDNVWTGKEKTFEESLINTFTQNGLELIHDKIADMMQTLTFIDSYIRNERRSLAIEMALESNYKLHVFGNGWDVFSCKNDRNLIRHDCIDYKKSLDVMANSKIVINNMPLFADGSHERIFSTMACGSLCLTDSNPYLEDNFKDKEDIFYYHWRNIHELPQIIREILSGYYNTDNIIANSRNKALSKYMWVNSAKNILDYCNNL